MISRRALLLGGAGALALTAAGSYGLVEADVLPGRLALDQALGGCSLDPRPPAGQAPVTQGRFTSRFRRAEVGYAIVGGRRGVPVVVALHGWAGGAADLVRRHRLDHYLGDAPFAIVAVDGGATYWHPRANGDDPIRMITDELLPRLHGMRTDRVGVMGISMGGYGALLLGQTLGHRAAAVVASSPAVFTSYAAARGVNGQAFDNAADFARNNVLHGLGRLDRRTTWVDCGRTDPFSDVTKTIRHRLDDPAGGIFKGCHDTAYWRSRLPAQLAFLRQHLAP